MRGRTITVTAILVFSLWTGLFAFQRGMRGMRPWWYDDESPLITPPDANEKTEYVFARLRYPSYGRGPGGIWALRGNWTIDFPKADRTFVMGVRRLSRIHVRSVEEVVDFDDNMFNYPWIYVVEPGHWELTDPQVKRLRDFLIRGGFLMTDDFHGTFEWDVFMQSMSKVFPDTRVV